MGKVFRRFHRHGPNQDWLSLGVQALDPLDHGRKLALQGWVKEVWFIFPRNRSVSWNRDGLHVVNFPEFFLFRLSSSGHPGQLAVHPEQVLVGNVGHRLVFFLDLDPFLGFDCLVEAVREPPALHNPAGKGVNDQHFTVRNHVVLIQKHDVVSPQCLVKVVGQGRIFRIIKVFQVKVFFCLFNPLVSQ